MRAPGRLVAGATIVGALALVALLSLAWTPRPVGRIAPSARLSPPSLAAPLGTDPLGRDVASLMMAGAWTSLSTAVPAVALGGLLGTLVGMASAIRRGALDAVFMRGCDVVFAVPPILSALMLASLVGPGRGTAVLAIAVFLVPVFARLARAATLATWSRDFILAAVGAGKGRARIAFEHVLPNIAGALAVQATIQVGLAILTEAGLAYVGLGAPPPTPSWGRMLAEAQTYLAAAPWLVLAPGAAVAVAVLGLNLVGDGLRDAFDARGGR